jgi:retron-type reverse transcriptase
MLAPVVLSEIDLPALPDPGALGRLLELDDEPLHWLADCEGHERRRRATARHYHYTRTLKVDGSERLIEAPKPRLKAAQRRLLRTLLERIPPHAAAHGFVRGRSMITGAVVHEGQAMVVRVDLRDFFASIRASRIHALFTTLRYSAAVARMLTGLCTNTTPRDAWGAASPSLSTAGRRERWHRLARYAMPHLPAGAPTSPALANLAAFRLDRRLAALARSMQCRYTRYADDLTFSGGESLRRCARSCFSTVCGIAVEEGFAVHPGKTRFQPQSVRQTVTGLVVNAHANVPREDYDRLRAILFNCVRFGPRTQTDLSPTEFAAQLRGRIEWCGVNPQRAAKLRRLFDRIAW